MQQSGADARRVEPKIGEDSGYTHRVHDVRLTRLPGLARVHAEAVVVGSLYQLGIDRGLVRLDALDEVFDLKHQRARRAWPGKKK
jgi:hypothetical protein